MPNPFHRRPLLLLLNGLMCFSRQVTWEVRQDDVFPLANEAHAYWSGYFTSRPALKGYVRTASAIFGTTRLAQALAAAKNESKVGGAERLQLLEEALGVSQHHDAVSGTAKQHVAFGSGQDSNPRNRKLSRACVPSA